MDKKSINKSIQRAFMEGLKDSLAKAASNNKKTITIPFEDRYTPI